MGREAQTEQEKVADGLIRDYINALLANKPTCAAKSTKRMVDYVFATPPAAQPAQELTLQQQLDKALADSGKANAEIKQIEKLMEKQNGT